MGEVVSSYILWRLVSPKVKFKGRETVNWLWLWLPSALSHNELQGKAMLDWKAETPLPWSVGILPTTFTMEQSRGELECPLSGDKLPFPGKWLLADNEVVIYLPAPCNKQKHGVGHICNLWWLESPLALKLAPISSAMIHNNECF